MITSRPISTKLVAPPTPVPPSRRATGAAGLLALTGFVAAVLVAPKQDVTTSAQLHVHLEDNGWRQAVAWLLTLSCGLTWLLFIVGLRRLLPESHGRELFTVAALAGQATTWAGASLNTAAAAPGSRGVSLPVYEAFGEAGHLAVAAGRAATGLALIGLARAAATTRLWPTAMTPVTAVAGALLILTAVIGPVSVPVYVLWLLVVSIQLLLLRYADTTSSPSAPEMEIPNPATP